VWWQQRAISSPCRGAEQPRLAAPTTYLWVLTVHAVEGWGAPELAAEECALAAVAVPDEDAAQATSCHWLSRLLLGRPGSAVAWAARQPHNQTAAHSQSVSLIGMVHITVPMQAQCPFPWRRSVSSHAGARSVSSHAGVVSVPMPVHCQSLCSVNSHAVTCRLLVGCTMHRLLHAKLSVAAVLVAACLCWHSARCSCRNLCHGDATHGAQLSGWICYGDAAARASRSSVHGWACHAA
jgi:hypothetical protein